VLRPEGRLVSKMGPCARSVPLTVEDERRRRDRRGSNPSIDARHRARSGGRGGATHVEDIHRVEAS